ncbi:MAG: hypothetical protein JKY94_16805 [Rhodobacteraceae bacterium]|nr:hypothetical protein [Paracoccaceae bacterium]
MASVNNPGQEANTLQRPRCMVLTAAYDKYNVGELATFPEAQAQNMIKKGVGRTATRKDLEDYRARYPKRVNRSKERPDPVFADDEAKEKRAAAIARRKKEVADDKATEK